MKNMRERTYRWADPRIAAASAMKMSDYDYLKEICDGEIPYPPIMTSLGINNALVKEGFMSIEFIPEEYHYNTIGGVHGGVFSTLLDSCMSCAVHSTLPQGVGFSTLELKVNFLRPITVETGPVTCEGLVIHSGKKTSIAEGKIIGPSGKLFAIAQATCSMTQHRTS